MSTGTADLHNPKSGTDSQDSSDVPQQFTSNYGKVIKFSTEGSKQKPCKNNVLLTHKGVENAKKRLRAFSIQKKSSMSPVSIPKPVPAGVGTVFIGKLTSAKTQSKPEPPDPTAEQRKPPKPPKPGAKQCHESYVNTQKKTLAEIEDMKRQMELVDLGIPLGLICPAPNSDKAMPTKAMPPIKSFIDPAKVDELIRAAKKAKAEGKEFKFDYHKLLPDYDNPFQRKKEEPSTESKSDEHESRKVGHKVSRRSDKYDSRRHTGYKPSAKDRFTDEKHHDKQKEKDDKFKDNERAKDRHAKPRDKDLRYKERDRRSKERESKLKERDLKKEEFNKDEKEAEVNLEDFVVCDSWSENEEKSKDSTPKPEEKQKPAKEKTPVVTPLEPMEQLRESLGKKDKLEIPKTNLQKLKPVTDSFKFEIEDTNEDEVLDTLDTNSSINKFPKVSFQKDYDSPDLKLFEYDLDDMADDTFLESVINEIKQEEIDETSQDRALVEYDESPSKDSKDDDLRDSVTPEMDEKVRELHSTRDRMRQIHSRRTDYPDGYKSGESGKSVESGYKSTDSLKLSESVRSGCETEMRVDERTMPKHTVDSLETWSFVLKICQPLLFRHDKSICFKETHVTPKLWFNENPKLCNCVKDRRVVYKELEMCKMELVDSLYNAKQVQEAAYPTARGWYPTLDQSLAESNTVQVSSEWEAEDSQTEHLSATPERRGDISLDKEYQRFMEAVWPEAADGKSETPRSSPVRRGKKRSDDQRLEKEKVKKMKLAADGWSQDSDAIEAKKSYNALQHFLCEALHFSPNPEIASKKVKIDKQKRKRKHSTSVSVTDSSETDAKRRKKMQKKKDNRKAKAKEAKRRRMKKNIKKKGKLKKKKIIKVDQEIELQDLDKEKKKKEKKIKKKKLLKQKKKNLKKKKAKAKSSSSSSASSSDSESEPEKKSKKKKKSSEKKKCRKSSSESNDELFDVNILNNIKTERVTDDEKSKQLEFSPRRQKPREIIDVKELQSDFVGNSIQIKKEIEIEEQKIEEEILKEHKEEAVVEKQEDESQESKAENVVAEQEQQPELKEQDESQSMLRPEESNVSQSSSQESIYSLKDQPLYEKDESHLRPSSQNSNYSFHDVMASGMYKTLEHGIEEMNSQEMERHEVPQHEIQRHEVQRHDMQSQDTHSHDIQSHDMQRHDIQRNDVQIHDVQRHDVQHNNVQIQDVQRHDVHTHELQSHDIQIHDVQRHDMVIHDGQRHVHEIELDSQENYEHGDYEMYEQMAMAYQSDVASQQTSPPNTSGEQRIETVVHARTRGEIKCDWRAGDNLAAATTQPLRPSRWGLKPGDVNIVLTGGNEQFPIRNVVEPVYKIQSIANRTDNSATGYDEAYMDMYGALDKLQYGDCFSSNAEVVPSGDSRRATITKHASTLDDRIDRALRTTVLGNAAKDADDTDDKDIPDKGILVTKCLALPETRAAKRVTFADGYQPGQDSDVEDPPVKKKKKSRRLGCAWPCPATHPDHVPLWDALPPPPPPAGSPPPPAPPPPPPAHLLRQPRPSLSGLAAMFPPPPHGLKFDPNSMPAFMPPEPPPGLISFQNCNLVSPHD